MATNESETKLNPNPNPNPTVGLRDTIQNQYLKIREHAETYPYVWGSYILVYGGLGAYLAWRWRKLRRTEDRVRVLQGRLRKLVEEEEAAASATSAGPGSDGGNSSKNGS